VKPTSDDFEPRRDGWYEHKGIWDEVTVGTVIGTKKRSEAFEVIATAHGPGIPFGHTLWFKVKNLVSGKETPISPKWRQDPVTILTRDPRDTRTPDRTHPVDAEAVMLLIQELGAETLASWDAKTGVVTCPDYVYKSHLEGDGKRRRGLREHLEFAHGIETPIELDDAWEDLRRLDAIHAEAHKNPVAGRGFPHRHVPDLDPEYFG
jgi:hypothetical protein